MKREEIETFKGGKVTVNCKNTFHYTGTITRFFDDCFQLTDKFNLRVMINYADVVSISEVA